MLIDLHTHTRPMSDDSTLDPDKLIEVAKRAGLDAICFTEHDWFWPRKALAQLSEEHDFLVIPGVEINTEEGHLLVFGVEKYSFGMHRVGDVKRIVDEVGGAIALAHPYRRHLLGRDDLDTSVERFCQKEISRVPDAIEAFNGRSSERENLFSQKLCHRLNLKGVGGSDAHYASDIPSFATFFEREIRSVEELITELKAGRFKPVDLRQNSSG